VGDGGLHGRNGFGAGLVILVADDRFPESLQLGDARGDFFHLRAIPVRREKITRLGHLGVNLAVAITAGGHQQAGRRLFGQTNQAGLPFRVADDRVHETLVRILVGNLEQHILKPAFPHPARRVHDARAHRRFVAQHLRLPLVVKAEDDDHAVAVASANRALDPRQIRGPQAAIRFEGRVERALVTGHSALQTKRESVHAVRGVIADPRDEPVRVRLRIKVRLVAILEDGVDHAHIHQQTLGGAARIRGLIIQHPAAIAKANARRHSERLGCGNCRQRKN